MAISRRRVAKPEGNESLLRGRLSVSSQTTRVTAAFCYHDGNVVTPRFLHCTLKRAVASNLTEVPAAIDDGRRVCLMVQSDGSTGTTLPFLASATYWQTRMTPCESYPIRFA